MIIIAISLVTMYSIQYANAVENQLKFDQPTIILNHGDIITYTNNNGDPEPIIITLTNSNNDNTMSLQLVNVPGTNIFRTMVKFTSDTGNDAGIPSYTVGTSLPVQVTATVTTPANGAKATSSVTSDTTPIPYQNRRTDNTWANCSSDDRDGDGICDSWENSADSKTLTINYPAGTSSYTFTCDNSPINPPCDSNQRDIFVEIDYMLGHKPNFEAIQSVVDAFAKAPDPDGPNGPITEGIRLHVQIDDSKPIPHTDVTQFPGLNISGKRGFDQIKAFSFGTLDEQQRGDWINGWKQKKQAFHYVLFVHNQGTSSSGAAEILGNDVIISLGSFDYQIGNPDQQAGTLMHELGHNLNLNHGGGPTNIVNCKPNYLSVMSYSRQFSDLVSNRSLDFSNTELQLLNENQLNEKMGLNPKNSDEKIIFGPIPPIILPSERDSIDWNQDGTIQEDTIPSLLDINSLITNSGIVICSPNSDIEYSGYDDWKNIVLNSKGTGNWADGRSVGPDRFEESPTCPPINKLNRGESPRLNRVCGGGFGDTDYVIPTQYEYEINPMESLTTNQVTISQGSSSPGCETTKNCYNPNSIEIRSGDTVSWSNDDTAAHTVTSGTPDGPDEMFDSGLFMAGSTFEFTFDKSGIYPYFCIVHPWMTGEIIVNEIMVKEPNDNPIYNDKTESSNTLDPVDDKEFEDISYENSEITSDAVKSMRILRIDSLENYVNNHYDSIDKDSSIILLDKYQLVRKQISNERYADVVKTLNSIDYDKLVKDSTVSKKLKIATNDVILSIGQAVAEPVKESSCPSGQKMNEQGKCTIDPLIFILLAIFAIVAAVIAIIVKTDMGTGIHKPAYEESSTSR